MIRRYFLALAIGAILTACTATTPSPDATYFLVRHAEKTKAKIDPALTQAGEKRAHDLAARLKDVKLSRVFSSDYKRTRDTAAPVAAEKKLEVLLYDPTRLDDFAQEILRLNENILVVGHSNTTPELSVLLGGESGPPIIETTEYDRLYILTRNGKRVSGKIEKYGEKS